MHSYILTPTYMYEGLYLESHHISLSWGGCHSLSGGTIGVPVRARVCIGLLFGGWDDSAVGRSVLIVRCALFRRISPEGVLTRYDLGVPV